MRFRCERDVLVEALSTAQRAVTNRNAALPVLAGVRLELSGDTLRVTGTDLDLFAQVQVQVVGEADGSAVVPARLAADIVRSLEAGVVRVDGGEDELKISSGRAEFSVRTYVAADFPKVPAPAERSVTLPAAVLGEALRQVVRAASSDEGVPIITGVLLAGEAEGLRLVATDKYRLAVRDDAAHQASQPVGIGRYGELLNDLGLLRQQANIQLLATQIQSSVHHENGPPRARSSVAPGSCHRGGPLFHGSPIRAPAPRPLEGPLTSALRPEVRVRRLLRPSGRRT